MNTNGALMRAVGLAIVSPLLGRLRPARLERVLRAVRLGANRDEDAPGVAERALAVSGHLIRHTCYTRGITRYVVLRRGGFDASLVFGMDGREGGLGGHCWIELDSAPYREATDPRDRFPPVWRIPDPGDRVLG